MLAALDIGQWRPDKPPAGIASRFSNSMSSSSMSSSSRVTTSPAELAPALKRALAVVKSGQPALVDIVSEPR